MERTKRIWNNNHGTMQKLMKYGMRTMEQWKALMEYGMVTLEMMEELEVEMVSDFGNICR